MFPVHFRPFNFNGVKNSDEREATELIRKGLRERRFKLFCDQTFIQLYYKCALYCVAIEIVKNTNFVVRPKSFFLSGLILFLPTSLLS